MKSWSERGFLVEGAMAGVNTHDRVCQRVVEDSQIAIIFADRDGIIHFWNTGAEAMFGYPAEEALGQTLDLIVPERQRSRHWAGYHRVMANGVSMYGRVLLAIPEMTKIGRRISIEFGMVRVRGPTVELLG